MKTRFFICNDKIIVLHFFKLFWPSACFVRIFLLYRGSGLSQAKKNSKQALYQKCLDTVHCFFFCNCAWKMCSFQVSDHTFQSSHKTFSVDTKTVQTRAKSDHQMRNHFWSTWQTIKTIGKLFSSFSVSFLLFWTLKITHRKTNRKLEN